MLPAHFPWHRLAGLPWKGLSTSLASCARRAFSSRDPWTAEIRAANEELEEAFNTRMGAPGQFSSSVSTSVDPPLSALSQLPVPPPYASPTPPSVPRPPSGPLQGSQGAAAEAAQHAWHQSTEQQPADRLTHVDDMGHASMVDVSQKTPSVRSAQASGCVYLGPKAYELVAANRAAKGDVLAVSQIAGIMAAKQTSTLIPLCHGIPLNKVDITFQLDPSSYSVRIKSEASCTGVTGVEMEALTAVCVASLTVYDMCKAASKGIVISDIRLEAKTGGKSGDWRRTE
ncbi:Molybdopterin biosynthesis protein CNX3 [Dunaliella salina]|uniref:cyclic pyranopterin monophosphate synthase n=1 Tax=Dunaliella salina TaxID=3046 RepID=A0ABQ7GNC8_DUNSA|nr:Molybdopterin biosynthesis protein CNX3 [Dunaliella salina]|eukprot:KAF5836129.1 Molybdopterin biosynthesis protein CNX3 [Dunaliella salina]